MRRSSEAMWWTMFTYELWYGQLVETVTMQGRVAGFSLPVGRCFGLRAPGVMGPFHLWPHLRLHFRQPLRAQREVPHGDPEALLVGEPHPWVVNIHCMRWPIPTDTKAVPHKSPSQRGSPWSPAENRNSLLEVSTPFLCLALPSLQTSTHYKFYLWGLLSFPQYNVNSNRDFLLCRSLN